MTMFAKFTETNEWEGETWVFWLQLDGNEDELRKFGAMLSDTEVMDPDEYRLDLRSEEIVAEYIVDNLVADAESGYMDFENKVTGKFTCPETLGSYGGDLYKGQIREMFV